MGSEVPVFALASYAAAGRVQGLSNSDLGFGISELPILDLGFKKTRSLNRPCPRPRPRSRLRIEN